MIPTRVGVDHTIDELNRTDLMGELVVTGLNFAHAFKRALSGLSLAVVIGAGSMFAANTVSAQAGAAAGFAELNIHDYLHRDVVLIAQALDLDEGQRMIVESLYEDYRYAFDEGWQETQQRFADMREELQDVDRDRIMEMVLKPFEDWQQEKLVIKGQFEDNVKIILNEQQREQWPAFQRQMTREKSLHRGRLSGESLNLFHVLRDLRLGSRAERNVQSVLNEYDRELHQALLARDEALADAQRDMFRSIRDQNHEVNLAQIDRQIQLRLAIRNVNDRYIDRIAENLPSEHRDEFRAAALERGYPRVYRPIPAVRVFNEAMELDELDSEQVSEIRSLRDAMMDELVEINRDLHQGLREHEPKAMRNQAEIMAARQNDEQIDRLTDPNIAKYRNRNQRASHYMDRLREIITYERFAGLSGASRYLPARNADDPAQRDRAKRELIKRRGGGTRGNPGTVDGPASSPRRNSDR